MAELSGKYKIATKNLISGAVGVYLVDPETGTVIAQLAFTNQVSSEQYGKIAGDLEELLTRNV